MTEIDETSKKGIVDGKTTIPAHIQGSLCERCAGVFRPAYSHCVTQERSLGTRPSVRKKKCKDFKDLEQQQTAPASSPAPAAGGA